MVSTVTLDTIKTVISLPDLVGQYVTLKQQGRKHLGCCPFHDEKTPSFYVQDIYFKCFGCGAGGDAFAFLTKYLSISFLEAVEQLGEMAGVDVELEEGTSQKEYEERKGKEARARELLDLCQNMYVQSLWNNADNDALAYMDMRGIHSTTAHQFGLGYAPDSYQFVTPAIVEAKLTDIALELGIIKMSKERYYDAFRNRLLMPIFDSHGLLCGWSGRLIELPQDDEEAPVAVAAAKTTATATDKKAPKYLNSADSFIFNKSKLLFGWNMAQDAIRETGEVIKVEGNLDVVLMHQHQMCNTVAPLGTALTAEQCAMLKRSRATVLLLNDGDEAGLAATQKHIDLLISNDINCDVVTMPEGMDPADFLRKQSCEQIH